MSDESPASPQSVQRGRVIRWIVPVIGAVLLAFGGMWAVDISQGPDATAALNPTSAALYTLMSGLYAAIATWIRRWRQPTLPFLDHATRAAGETLLVSLAGSPAIVFGELMTACYAGYLCQ